MGQLEDMQVFIRVVEADGIGRAAEQLGIAKSAVSRRLSELEKRLGTRLINRTTRSSSLTDAGQRFYERSMLVVDQVAELQSDLQEDECALAGNIRLAAPLSFGLRHLAAPVSDFMQEHPQVRIRMDFSDKQVDIVEDGFDLALRIADLKDSTLQARKIFPCHHALVASPDYLKRVGQPKSVVDLENLQFLKYAEIANSPILFTDANDKRYSINPESHIVTNNGDFLLQMACKGHGLVTLPTFVVWESLASGELVEVLPELSLPSIHAFLVYPRNRYLPRRIRLFIDFIANQFGDQPYWDAANA